MEENTLKKKTSISSFYANPLLFLALLMGLAIPVQPVRAATSSAVVYDAISNPLPPNMPSVGFQATRTSEFGDHIHLAGTNRGLKTITITMSDWALYSDYSSDARYMGNSATWSHPITINVYNNHLGANGAPDTLLATLTQMSTIPWRPVADPTCLGGTAWKASNGTCYNGFAFNITFDMSSLNITLPNDIIVGVAYNTQNYGVAPIGVTGPYNSLNVGVEGSATVGTDDNIDRIFWNTSTPGNYADSGTAGAGVFREDTGWTPYTVPIQITAESGFLPMTQWTGDYNYNEQQWRIELHPRVVADVNKDGCADIIGFGFDQVLVALSNCSNGFGPMTQWTTDFSYNAQGWRVDMHPRMMADVNNDKCADIVGFGYDRVLVALSNCVNGFYPMTQWTGDYNYNEQQWRIELHPRMVADVNQDGCADIVGFGFDRVLVALSNCSSGFGPMTQWTTDFSYNAQGWRVDMHPRMMADVNNDGCADIIGFGYDRVLAALSNCVNGFYPMTQWTSDYNYNEQQWRIELHPRMVADVNKDGCADIVGFGFDLVFVSLSNCSNGFGPMTPWTTDFSYNAQGWRVDMHPRMLADVNNDGRADIIGFGYDRVLVAIAR
jgi:hypothetical protein